MTVALNVGTYAVQYVFPRWSLEATAIEFGYVTLLTAVLFPQCSSTCLDCVGVELDARGVSECRARVTWYDDAKRCTAEGGRLLAQEVSGLPYRLSHDR